MRPSRSSWLVVAKLALAAVLFPALVWGVGAVLGPAAPAAPAWPLLLVVALVVVALAAGFAMVSLALGQWALRQGGTDPQWFWFPGEPKGLERLRERRAGQTK